MAAAPPPGSSDPPGAGGAVLPAFERWMDGAGIARSPAIRLVPAAPGCSGLALGVVAARDIAADETLCTIPKAACLSIRTTAIADVIEAEGLGGGLGLVLAVMHERSLGADSRWHGYFAALPAREYLPLFWTDAQLALLQGTELAERAEADREAAREDFQEHVLPLLQRHPGRLRDGAVTLPAFHAAASLVASRAFGVDEWHGDAMVPLADIFNHKASVVDLGEGYEVHGAGSDSEESEGEGEEGGEEEGSEGSEGSGGEEEEGVEGDEESGSGGEEEQQPTDSHPGDHVHAPGGGCCEGQNGGGAGATPLPAVMTSGDASIYGLRSANGLHLRLQMGIVDRDEQTLEIVAPSAVPAGQEVHNTYGELGNAELVKKYGFALRQNPFTAVSLPKAPLLEAARAALGAPRWRRRAALLREQTDVLEEEEEPFEVLPNGHVSPALYVALRVLCAPDAEAAAWSTIGDALRLPVAAAAAAAGGSGGDDSGDEGEAADVPDLDAVQVWRVTDEDGRPLPADGAAAAGGAAAADAEQQQQGGYAALLNRQMCELLQGAARQRLGAYAGSLEADLTQLAELEAQQQQQEGEAAAAAAPAAAASDEAAAAAADHSVAQRAALVLRVTEKEVLLGLLAALERRLAALPAEPAAPTDGTAAEAAAPKGKQRAAAKAAGKRKAAAAEPAGGKAPAPRRSGRHRA